MRAKTSRPAESVPNQCAALGGFLIASRSTENGSGASHGAMTASAITMPRTIKAAPATRSRRKRDHAVFDLRLAAWPSVAATTRVGMVTTVATLAVPNPRVGVGVQDVGKQITEQHQG